MSRTDDPTLTLTTPSSPVCLDAGFSTKSTLSRGRVALSNSKYKRGDVITRNIPFAYALKTEFMSSRCATCFSKGKIDRQTSDSSSLASCAQCKLTKYCNRTCQLQDWKTHKTVCAHLPRLVAANSSMADEAVILLKSIQAILAQEAKTGGSAGDLCTTVALKDGALAVKCGCKHVGSMALGGGGTYTDHTIRVIDVVCEIAKCSVELASSTYLKFRSNNFGISDEMMNCIGMGVFPRSAILNHSCTPNAYLRYKNCDTHYTESGILSPVVEVVAMIDIDVNQEICHSYLDLTYNYSDRVEILGSNYGFRCNCDRCGFNAITATATATVPTAVMASTATTATTSISSKGGEGDNSDIMRDRELLCSCFSTKGAETETAADVDILSLLTHIDNIKQSRRGDSSYIIALAEGTIVGFKDEKAWNAEKSKLLKRLAGYDAEMLQGDGAAASERLFESRVLAEVRKAREFTASDFNSEFYRLNTRLFDHYILTGDISNAYSSCKRIVAYLLVALMNVSFSPLIGLHFYTLGDLAKHLGMLQEARTFHQISYDNLLHTHGSESDFVRKLIESLSEFEHAASKPSNKDENKDKKIKSSDASKSEL